MITLRRTLALATAVAASAPTLGAQGIGTGIPSERGQSRSQVGIYAGTFLEIPVGAREAALAGAVAATTAGLSALYWNTAATADLGALSGTLSRSSLYGSSGLTHTFGAIGMPIGGNVVALSVTYFTSGDIDRTTEQFPEGADPSAGATVRWDAFSTGLHFSRRLTDRLSFGVAGKYIVEGVDFATASWIAGDLSTLFRTGIFATTLGASISNLSGGSSFGGPALERNIPRDRDAFPVSRDVNVQFDMKNVNLPAIAQFAISTEVFGGAGALRQSPNGEHGLTVSGAMQSADDRPLEPTLAVEYRFRNMIAARVGKRFRTDTEMDGGMGYGLSGGFGLAFPVMQRRMTFDYAAWYQSTTALPINHTITLQFGY